MSNTLNEDEYWENRRERLESGRRYGRIVETESLSLDDRYEEIQEQYGYPVEDLNECDLCEIVQRVRGIHPKKARWNNSMSCIVFEFYKEVV